MPADLAVVLACLAGGVVLLAVLAAAWVPRQAVQRVSRAEIDDDFTAEEQQRERRFRRRVRPWGLAGMALGVLVPTVLVVTGAAGAVAARVAGPVWWQVVVVVVTTLGLTRLATLPGAVVVRRESLRVGLAAGPWSRWWRDVAVSSALGWGAATVALVAWVGVASTLPGTWWAVLAVGAAVVVVVVSFVVPVLVEPLFARFEPLSDGELRTRLLALAEEAGIEVRDVLVADASRRTTALNAYVSGLGPTRRVVVHDTLVSRGRDDEVLAVVAHELGHVAAHDVRTGTVLGALGAATAVLAAAVVLTWSPLLEAAHVEGPADPAVAALLIALGGWAGLLTAPAQSALSRRIERRADSYGLELAQAPATVASMQRSLAVVNLAPLRPVRVLHLWFGTHPTSPERISAARAWARDHGQPAVGPLRPGGDGTGVS